MDIKVSAYVACSLDGYIARLNGKLDWLERASVIKDTVDSGGLQLQSGAARAEDFGYADFFDTVGCVVLGRHTFEKAVDFPTWPYGTKRVVVLSRKLKQIPDAFMDRADLYTGPEEMLIVQLQAAGIRRVYVDGGLTIQSFIRKDLLTDIIITRVPVLLGKGIPLFGPLTDDIELRHLSTKTFANGFVQSHYQFERYGRRRD